MFMDIFHSFAEFICRMPVISYFTIQTASYSDQNVHAHTPIHRYVMHILPNL